MTDHELIMAAAKVEGITLKFRDDGVYEIPNDSFYPSQWWNPLTSDDDAFRLMVKHTLIVIPQDGHSVIVDWYGKPDAIEEPFRYNKYAATRRAIVRAVIAKAHACNRIGCSLTPPCPDCGLALHDFPADG